VSPSRWALIIVPLLVLSACEDDEPTSPGESSATTVTTSEVTTTTAIPTTATTAQSAAEERGHRYRGALLRHTASGMTIDGRALPGVTQLSGALIVGDPPNFVLDAVRDAAGEMVWFGLFEGERSGDDPPPTRILDTLDVPAHPGDQHVQITECGPRGKGTAPEFFALVQGVRNAPTHPVIQAWRADRTTRKIKAVPADQIECQNAGYGS